MALKNWRRDLKNVSYDEIEGQIRDATCNSNEQPSSDLIERIGIGMCDRNKYRLAWLMLWKRAADEKVPKHVSKSLVLIDFFLRVNPPSLQVQVWLVQSLKEFEPTQYLTKLRQGEGPGGVGLIAEIAKTIGRFVGEFKEPDPSLLAAEPSRSSLDPSHSSLDPSRTSLDPRSSVESPLSPSRSPISLPGAVIFNTPKPYSPFGPAEAVVHNLPTPYSPYGPPGAILYNAPTPYNPDSPPSPGHIIKTTPSFAPYNPLPQPWTCAMCTFVNQPNSAACQVCGFAKPVVAPSSSANSCSSPSSPHSSYSPSSVVTPSAGYGGSGNNFFASTSSSVPMSPLQTRQVIQYGSQSIPASSQQQQQQQQLQQQQQQAWDCPRCKFFNSGIDVVCNTCFGPRTVPPPVISIIPVSPALKPTHAGRTWTCSMCRHANQETAASCAHCWCSRPIDVTYNDSGMNMMSSYGNTSNRIAGIINASVGANAAAHQNPSALPPGWEERIDPRINRSYFVNHAKSVTTWDDPRKAAPVPAPPAYQEPVVSASLQIMQSSVAALVKKNWVCSLCTAHNNADNTKCMICEGPRQGNEPEPPEDRPKPAPAMSTPTASVTEWACVLCSYVNTLPKYQAKCEICDGPRPPSPAPKREEAKQKIEEVKQKVEGWECDWCCTVNDSNQTHCQLCFTPKPDGSEKVVNTSDVAFTVSSGGASNNNNNKITLPRAAALWQCARCCHTSEYVQCPVCGQPEPPKTTAAAIVTPAAVTVVEANLTTHKPVATLASTAYSVGSWQCSFCDVINNAKKEECRICSRSRAVAAVVELPPQVEVPAAAVSDPFVSLDNFGVASSAADNTDVARGGELSRKYSAPPPFSPLLFSENSAYATPATTAVSSSSAAPFFSPPAGPPPAHLLAKVAPPPPPSSSSSSSALASLSSDVKQFFSRSIPAENKSSVDTAAAAAAPSQQISSPASVTRNAPLPRKYSGISPPPPPAEKSVDDAVQAAKIRAEVYATEQTYVFNLTRLLTVFIRPINQKSKSFGLSQAQTVDLCGNISVIARLHTVLVQDMQKEDIVEVLLKNADFLKIYTSYVNNYEKMIATITLLSKNKNFEKFLAETEREQMSLPSYLIMPIQRIPRYCLLLRELQKNTSDQAANFPRLCLALDKLKAIAACINEQKRKFENTSQLLDIQTRIRAPAHYLVLKPGRTFVRQGKLKRMDDDVSYYFFLFNDALLQTTDKYKVVQEIDINAMTLQARSVDTLLFTVLQKQHKGKLTELNLVADVAAERDAWVSDLQTALNQNSEPASGGEKASLANAEEPFEVILEGVLQKRGSKNNRYQERYFELLGSMLIYRKRKGAAERAGELRMRDISAVRNMERADRKGGEFELDVNSVGEMEVKKYGMWRTFFLQANTGAEAFKWIQAIQRQMEAHAVTVAGEKEQRPEELHDAPLLQSSGASLFTRSQADVIRSGWIFVRDSSPAKKERKVPAFQKRYVMLTPAHCACFVNLEDVQMGVDKAEISLSLHAKLILVPVLAKGSVAREDNSWGLESEEHKLEFQLCGDDKEELPNLAPNFHHIPETDVNRRKESWLLDFRVSLPCVLFGVSLELAATRSDPAGKIPTPIVIALKWLDERGLEEQGLYRIPGSKTEVDNLIAQFDRGESVHIPDQYSGNNLASLVVQYLRRLPENLFTNNLAPIFQRAMGSEQQLSMLKLLLGKLPLAHFCTIRALVRHLVRVSQLSEANEMTAQNLSICVYTSMAQVMNALIVNYDYVFDQPEPGPPVAVVDDSPPAFGVAH